jgi:outer membrane protein
MKNIVVTTFALLVAVHLFSQQKWTLEQAVAYAIENNITIKQSELDLQLADIQESDAFYRLFPNLNANATFTSNTGNNINPGTNVSESFSFLSFSTGVQTSVTLFDGLRNIRQLQYARMTQVAGQYNLDKMKDDIALFVANAYLQTLFNKENLKVLKSQNEITKQQLNQTNELVDAGVIPRGDLLEIKAALANDEQRIVVAENQIRIALINLAQILLIKDYENFDIADDEFEVPISTILEQPVSAIIERAKETRYETKIAEKNVMLAEKELQISRGAYTPTLSAFAGYSTSWIDNDFFERSFSQQFSDNAGTRVGLQLQVPIFNGFSVRNNVKRSFINIERASLQKEQAELDLESNVYQAYTDLQGAKKAYEAALVAEDAQSQAYDYSRESFEVGIINSFEFSQALLRYENAQSEVLRAKYDYIFKLKLLELYFGIPLY